MDGDRRNQNIKKIMVMFLLLLLLSACTPIERYNPPPNYNCSIHSSPASSLYHRIKQDLAMKSYCMSSHLTHLLLLLWMALFEGCSSFLSPLSQFQKFPVPFYWISTSCRATREVDPQHVPSPFLHQIEKTVQHVLEQHELTKDILDVPPAQRESLGVARNLHTRLQAFQRNNDCPRCWLQRAHCVCEKCPPLPPKSLPRNVRRIFLLMHHKEICLAVDTAKMILAAFPDQCQLVVGGIGPEYQESMAKLMDAMQDNNSLVLFPDENALTFQDMMEVPYDDSEAESDDRQWDVIVIDGTWSQARKMYARYIPTELEGGPSRIQLSHEAVDVLALAQFHAKSTDADESKLESGLSSGHQLRRHPIKWREVSTLEATRLLLGDMAVENEASLDYNKLYAWDALSQYQVEADLAAKRQLGPPRSAAIGSHQEKA